MKRIMPCLFVVLAVALGGCNTVRGFGQDLAAAGRALSNASTSVTGSSEPASAATPPPAAEGSSAPRSLTPPPHQ